MNKPLFLYNYYLKLPLRREICLFNTAKKAKKIIKRIMREKDIPGLSESFTKKYKINIHILCSHLSLECLLLSLTGFYAFSGEYAEIIIHEDGTFTKGDVSIIKKIFPWTRYVSLRDADESLKEKGFSDEAIKLRRKHKLLIKAIDFHHIESNERILVIDTDIFILGNMEELWQGIIEGREFVFNADPQPAYGSSKELLEKILGRRMEIDSGPCVNTGLVVEPAGLLREEKRTIELYCEGFEGFPYQRIHCIEQGYIACVLKDKKIPETPLPSLYKIVGHRDAAGVLGLKKYDFTKNPDSLEAIHLCGWDKLGKDFQKIKTKLLDRISKKIK